MLSEGVRESEQNVEDRSNSAFYLLVGYSSSSGLEKGWFVTLLYRLMALKRTVFKVKLASESNRGLYRQSGGNVIFLLS